MNQLVRMIIFLYSPPLGISWFELKFIFPHKFFHCRLGVRKQGWAATGTIGIGILNFNPNLDFEMFFFLYEYCTSAVDYPIKAVFQFNLSSGLHSFIYLSNIKMYNLLSAGSLEKDHISKMVIQR